MRTTKIIADCEYSSRPAKFDVEDAYCTDMVDLKGVESAELIYKIDTNDEKIPHSTKNKKIVRCVYFDDGERSQFVMFPNEIAVLFYEVFAEELPEETRAKIEKWLVMKGV